MTSVPRRRYSCSTERQDLANGASREAAGQCLLQLGLLIGWDCILVGTQAHVLPAASVEHPAGLGLEVGVTREGRNSVVPRRRMASAESQREVVLVLQGSCQTRLEEDEAGGRLALNRSAAPIS